MRDKKKARVREPCSTGGTKGALLRLTRSLYLTPSTENQPESSLLPGLMKPYLRSSAETKIKEYQTYLSSKLHTEQSITVGPEDLELLCRGKPLLNEMTLKEVWEEYWNSLEDDLQLTYRRRKACMLTWALKTLPEDLLTQSGLCPAGRVVMLGVTSKRVRGLLGRMQRCVPAVVRVRKDVSMESVAGGLPRLLACGAAW